MSDTTERTSARAKSARPRVGEYLFLVVEGGRLGAGGMRIALAGVDELMLGRGDARVLERASKATTKLTVPDSKMSSTHARVIRRDGDCYVVDAGSTNGTTKNGSNVTKEAKLADGDVLALGRTLFLFREIVDEGPAAGDGDVDHGDLAALPLGLATLDPVLAKKLGRLTRVGASQLSTMLLGETGTGKEVVARALHQLSKRPGPFAAVNCGAIPANLVESHLFGHVKGAFSGALRDEPGLVRSAAFGTLLLDEIGDLPLASQAALLRVLQEGEVLPVGSSKPVPVDLRIVCATHQPLEQLVEKGQFRRDLYARLAGFTLVLPPLRERIVDLGLFIAHLLARGKLGTNELRLHADAARAMLRYDWPSNVRELEQCLRSSAVLSEDGVITVHELPPAIADALVEGATEAEDAAGEDDEELRRELLVKLAETNGNISEVARAMGKARQQVQRWMRRLDIKPEAFRDKR